MKKLTLPAFALLCALTSASALEIQGVAVPQQVQVSGQTLTLNGAGLRTVTLLLIPIKAYVAAFYSPTPLRAEADVQTSPGPLQFTFTFLRAVSQSDVAQAWGTQFADSNTHSYPGFASDLAAFIAMFGPLNQGGVQMVQLVGTDTLVYDKGQLKGTLPGRDFQKSFLSLWFGSNPVAPALKAALLGS
ncbi:MAG: chalcone isomerase family protein [Terrimicrobiaceae bacterium]|jgi:hypothetical protein